MKKVLLLFLILSCLLVTSVNAIENIGLYAYNWSQSSCPCDTNTFEFDITNTGYFYEIYDLSVNEKISEYVTISNPDIPIGPQSASKVFIYVNLPCDVYGEVDFELIINTQNSGVEARVPLHMSIDRFCYNYGVLAPEVIELCARENNSYDVSIINYGDVANKYNLEISKSKYASIENSLSLNGLTDGKISLNLNPKEEQIGQDQIQLKVISERGQLEILKNISIEVKDCYRINVGVSSEKDTVCTDEINEYVISVENRGAEDEYVQLNGSSEGYFVRNLLNVKKGTIDETGLKIEFNQSGKYTYEITGSLRDKPEVNNIEDIEFKVVDKNKCDLVKFSNYKESVSYEDSVIDVSVKNKGIRQNIYSAKLISNYSWIKLQDDYKLQLDEGETGTFKIDVTPNSDIQEGEYRVLLNIKSDKGNDYNQEVIVNLKENTSFLSTVTLNGVGLSFFDKLGIWFYVIAGLLIALLVIVIIEVVRRMKKTEIIEEKEIEEEKEIILVEEVKTPKKKKSKKKSSKKKKK